MASTMARSAAHTAMSCTLTSKAMHAVRGQQRLFLPSTSRLFISLLVMLVHRGSCSFNQGIYCTPWHILRPVWLRTKQLTSPEPPCQMSVLPLRHLLAHTVWPVWPRMHKQSPTRTFFQKVYASSGTAMTCLPPFCLKLLSPWVSPSHSSIEHQGPWHILWSSLPRRQFHKPTTPDRMPKLVQRIFHLPLTSQHHGLYYSLSV